MERRGWPNDTISMWDRGLESLIRNLELIIKIEHHRERSYQGTLDKPLSRKGGRRGGGRVPPNRNPAEGGKGSIEREKTRPEKEGKSSQEGGFSSAGGWHSRSTPSFLGEEIKKNTLTRSSNYGMK